MPSSTSKDEPREAIRRRALAEGFDVVRFALPRLSADTTSHLDAFLAERRHASMGWLAANAARRRDPSMLWPEARSVVVAGLNYGPRDDPFATLAERERATISVYALGDDYHEILKKKLRVLAQFVTQRFAANVKLFVDTAPVMEKPIAESAGLGWQGKHTNLVSRQFGSWLFLGSLFTTLEIEPDAREADHCGQCRQCLDICPTKAFPAPYQLDAGRCISYLTIEHKGHIPREFREPIGNRIYGCDDCLAVCPWNKFASESREMRLMARADLHRARLSELAILTDQSFRTLFAGSPIKRIGRDRFVRNVLIAIGNSAEASLVPIAIELIQDRAPIVRAMAVWALSRLLPKAKFSALSATKAGQETDEDVSAEWADGRAIV